MFDNERDTVVVLHHFLMMTPALVRRSSHHQLAHPHIYLALLQVLPIISVLVSMLFQELHVCDIFSECPERFVVIFVFLLLLSDCFPFPS